ncbi:serine hydrolase domain-containing protein [Cellulomonas aerilata]|uniref:Beta-lactamase n=1 Tax=Cellulomonas aerilata TaxID=515326 RepID=A0A512DAR0_9CELL|nr:serine hydrolase domain-containing protein [Cellulomonas aerilata]GEO33564.1 hypothetical protein CAE01nite_12890 [Cellulomonas aerilata]
MTSEADGSGRFDTRVGELLDRRHPVCAAARVSAGRVAVSVRGAAPGDTFEIGSISKSITGLLYHDALARGEIGLDSTLGDLLPLGSAPAARVRLGDLATHRSGLPRLPKAAQPVRRTMSLWRHGTNPYGEDLEQLLAQVQGVRLGAARPRYSNLGFELLGHAVARAAAMTYAELVRARLADPLGLDSVHVPATPAELGPGALVGRSRRGSAREPWTGEAIGPAGGIRASVQDMARLTVALLDGSAPGLTALDGVAPFGRGAVVGAGWVTVDVARRPITWHNGGTGGFRSWIGLDRVAGTGVVVLSATSLAVDRAGFALLTEPTRSPVA